MRYIGSKVNLLGEIETFIKENVKDNSKVFMDLFSGTGTVGEFFKKEYKVLSNDNLYFSYVLQKAKIENNDIPNFQKLKEIGISEPLSYLEKESFTIDDTFFITKNYSPFDNNKRMYFTVKNASRIDFVRQKIREWKNKELISENEFYYLLAILIEAVPYISNISGTYGAYLKKWDKRTQSDLKLEPIEIFDNFEQNKSFNQDANKLLPSVNGDILYIDTPYNNRQYVTNYHVLETIALYDKPEIYGTTGLRPYADKKSVYCSKRAVYDVFNDLIDKAKFKHIIISYSTDGILTIEELEEILKKFGISSTFKIKKIPYRKYKSVHKQADKELFELLLYIQKDLPLTVDYSKPLDLFTINNIDIDNEIKIKEPTLGYLTKSKEKRKRYKKKEFIKSPLNYIGGKYKILDQLIPLFPTEINNFVDLFAGGLNVGINVQADKIYANDINSFVIEVLNAFKENEIDSILNHIHNRIKEYDLSKENEKGFKKFRDDYNSNQNPLDLYTLICFSFNYQFRFNNQLKYNNPFGKNRSSFSPILQNKLIAFVEKLHERNCVITNCEFENFNFEEFNQNDLVYCDPPYLITTGSYNDGNRGFKDWNLSQEQKLLNLLDSLNAKGVKFALSNVLSHKGKTNDLLIEWSKNYKVNYLNNNYSNSSHNTKQGESEEVLITNY